MSLLRLIAICLLPNLVASLVAGPVTAASYEALQTARPELFDATTGLRIARQRAPTPDNIPPPAIRIDTARTRAESAQGALLLDVAPAQTSRFDELDGRWLISKPHASLPGALWLPEVGRGRLSDQMQGYLADALARHARGGRAIVVFCVADCWMSWNAAQRIAAMGYDPVYWFREGISGWQDHGHALVQVNPQPVQID